MGKIKTPIWKIRQSRSDKFFYFVTNLYLVLSFLVVLYPIVYIFSASFSSTRAVMSGKVVLWPVELSLEGYKTVFRESKVLTGYLNTIFYTIIGTSISVILTIMAAYPLSRKKFIGRNFITYLFVFTFLFQGGMIPMYLLVQNLHLLNTRAALVIPNAIWVTNMIIARTYYQTNIPEELVEAGSLDGCSHFQFLFHVVLPLSKAITAVLVLYYAVGQWNAFFDAFLYLTNVKLFPIQIVLRDILVATQADTNLIADPELMIIQQGMAELLKYSLIIVVNVPIWLVYPFVQKYFVQGVMIGSIKG
ncbi:MAG: carbohydrate ABC transporter permease [Bacteroidales bacterium]|jgi:multiple sugar transport system permease protein/putative aldouronate transport system permease protein|nr:carbohydrate ABC transporter permease [Bacteroidales bacterium]